jgi:hypothetical protein
MSRDDDRGSRRSSRDDDDRGSRRSSSRDDDRGGRSSGRSSYRYEGRSKADIDKRSSQGANEFDKYLVESVKMFKPNDKDNTIRILPPTWAKPKHYGLDIYVHYGVGPDRQTYLCLHKMKDEKCPICEERKMAQNDGDEKLAKELEPKRRVLVYVIDRDNEKEGLQAWAMPWTVDRDICKISVDKKSGEVLPIDNPDEGYDVEFEKKGAKDRTEYLGIAVARRESSLGNDRWLEEAVETPLPETLVYYDYDHIAKAFGGGGSHKERSRDDDRDDDRKPARGRDDDRDYKTRRGHDDDDRDSRRRETEKYDKPADPDFSWADVHDMTGSELEALVDEHDLKVNPNKFDSDEELADAICKELDIEKPNRGRASVKDDDDDRGSRRGGRESKDEDEGRGKLAEMRRRREG